MRWFTRLPDEHILNWFSGKGCVFERVEARTDHYLLDMADHSIGIKLREGMIEIKSRLQEGEVFRLGNTVEGRLEDWIKWSFDLAVDHNLVDSIVKLSRYTENWLPIEKQRMGLKIVKKGEALEFHDIGTYLDQGCQIEYTRVILSGEVWYTFAVEWFGDAYFRLPPDLLDAIFGKMEYRIEQSKGYTEFIHTSVLP